MKQSPNEKRFLELNLFDLKESIKEDYKASLVKLKEDLKNNLDGVEQKEHIAKLQYLSWLIEKIIITKSRKVFSHGVGSVRQYLDYLSRDQSVIRVSGRKAVKIKAFLEMVMEHAPHYFAKNIEQQWEKREEVPRKK